MPKPHIRCIAFICLGVFLACSPAHAQSLWTVGAEGRSIGVELLKPNFQGDDDYTAATMVYFFSARFPVGDDVVVVGELPFAHAGVSDAGSGGSSNVVGNPYIGLELGEPGAGMIGELGVRLPTRFRFGNRAFAGGIGLYSDLDRWEAFVDGNLALSGMLNLTREVTPKFGLRARGGVVTSFYTNLWSSADMMDWMAAYGAQGWYDAGRARISSALTGRWYLSDGFGDIADNTIHHLQLHSRWALDRFEPSVWIRLPLDEETPLDFALGVGVRVPLGG